MAFSYPSLPAIVDGVDGRDTGEQSTKLHLGPHSSTAAHLLDYLVSR